MGRYHPKPNQCGGGVPDGSLILSLPGTYCKCRARPLVSSSISIVKHNTVRGQSVRLLILSAEIAAQESMKETTHPVGRSRTSSCLAAALIL
ncbi:hypothetical protein CDAR_586781 [Caerostris darwini]|uniref:Uncharacterized protein n=1 Tax=Caerostris darwini TaxID=1538125 RepID=A0AAV4SZ76_9ARAC|nr:hypothetical protein CDAR_586781 [Caerostris darwini]